VLNWNGDGKADVFVAAPDKGRMFSGATIMARKQQGLGVANANQLFEVQHHNFNDFAARGIVAGDVNGDGLDDLLFRDEVTPVEDVKSVYFLPGRPDNRLLSTLIQLPSQSQVIIKSRDVQLGAQESDLGIFRLGDLNRDGYDDFGVVVNLEVEGPEEASIHIFYGSGQYAATGAIAQTFELGDADVAIARQLPGQLAGGLGLVGFTTVTAGDFNADGRMDLAVGDFLTGLIGPGSQFLSDTRGSVYIFYSMADRLDVAAHGPRPRSTLACRPGGTRPCWGWRAGPTGAPPAGGWDHPRRGRRCRA
jgi:hypothetical protein